jgi:hypothetical protein
VLAQQARVVYVEFIAHAILSRAVWSLRCNGDLVVLTGVEIGFFPLWPDPESARFFSGIHWPRLVPAEVPLPLLLRCHLPLLAEAGVPVGIGVAPNPKAIVLRAHRLRRDLIAARRVA